LKGQFKGQFKRKGTFQKGHLYENVNMSTNVSRTHGSSCCVSNGRKLVLCSLIQAPK